MGEPRFWQRQPKMIKFRHLGTAFLIAPAEGDQVVGGSGAGLGGKVAKKNIAKVCARGWQSSPIPIGIVGIRGLLRFGTMI